MPSIEENLQRWTTYDWSGRGAEWTWGLGQAVGLGGDSVRHMWDFMVRPRVSSCLPCGHILEIAPGYGLWTHFLRPHARRMTLVDLAPNCIKHCRERFGRWGMRYIVNDGKSLAGVEDNTVDFVFSLNALVHAEHDVMRAYVQELARKLKPGGCGFIHHSNLADYAHELGIMDPALEAWHARDMSAKKFRDDCSEAGLHCIFQELLPWCSARMIACYSFFTRPLAPMHAETQVFENHTFWDDARRQVRISNHYDRPAPQLADDPSVVRRPAF